MRNLYLKIAVNAISKNRIVYIPYIFATGIMGMVLYFLLTLGFDSSTLQLKGGDTFAIIAKFGAAIFFILSTVFNIYLSFFITRRRQKEYGVLNILGMERRHLYKIIIIENLILAVSGSSLGIACGIVFYKLVQLALIKFLGGYINYDITVSPKAIVLVYVSYIFVYGLVFLSQFIFLRKQKFINYIRTLRRSATNSPLYIVLSAIGIILIIIAYRIEYSIPPDTRIFNYLENSTFKFVIASVLIVIATYLLFIFGAVTLIAFLKARKKLFYHKLNFVNLSTLGFRMRRSGLGLGTICLLSTVAIILTSALLVFFFSSSNNLEDMVDASFYAYTTNGEEAQYTIDEYNKVLVANDIDISDIMAISQSFNIRVNYYTQSGNFIESNDYNDYSYGLDILMIDEGSYTSVTGKDPDIGRGEMGIVFSDYFMKTQVSQFVDMDDSRYDLIPLARDPSLDLAYPDTVLFVYPGDGPALTNYYCSNDLRFVTNILGVSAVEQYDKETLENARHEYIENSLNSRMYIFNVEGDYEQQYNAYIIFQNVGGGLFLTDTYVDVAVDYMGVYKGLVFLCVMVLVMFIVMMAVTLYYKNLFEGMEDVAYYEVMRKVGMDDKLINKTVYIQMFVSLILPILVASIHALFSERYVIGFIKLLNINVYASFTKLTLLSTLVTIFFYMTVGLLASRTYIKIVKGKKKEE